jgi:hypothetical protein
MRPPILRWKVFLALVGVVLVAVALGSVLRPNSHTEHTLYFSGITQAHISPAEVRRLSVEMRRITVYRPHPGDGVYFLSPQEVGICGELRAATIAKAPEPFRPYLERIIRRVCR